MPIVVLLIRPELLPLISPALIILLRVSISMERLEATEMSPEQSIISFGFSMTILVTTNLLLRRHFRVAVPDLHPHLHRLLHLHVIRSFPYNFCAARRIMF